MIERINFWGIPEPWHYVAYVLPLAAGLYMVVRVLLRMRTLWKVGRPARRLDRLPVRLWKLIQHAILQLKVLRQRYPGLMHVSIAWGFFVLFLGTALATIDADIYKFLRGDIYLAFKFGLDLFTVVAFFGLALAAYRRFSTRPERLTLSNEFGLALLALSLILLSGLLAESLRLAAIAQDPGLQPGWEPALAWSTPAGWLVAQLWLALGLTPSALSGIHLGVWVFHLGLVSAILVVIPTTSLGHMLTSPANIFFSNLEQPLVKLTPAVNFEQGLAGAGTLSDFTWKQLMDGEACTECGRCQDACPAHTCGQPLSPKQVILAIASQLEAIRATGNGTGKAAFTGEIVTEEVLWACTTCGACVTECPVMIDHVGTIVDMRCFLVDQARIDPQLQTALDNLGRYGNSFGQSDRMRAKWSQPIEPKIKDARREPVRYLWYLGDFAAYHSGLTEITRKTAHVLQAAGVDFGMLYEGEKNAGNDVRRVGEEGLFEMLVEDNVAALDKATYEAIVTTDPHTYNTLKNEYPPEINGSRSILHYAQLLELVVVKRPAPPQQEAWPAGNVPRSLLPGPLQRHLRCPPARDRSDRVRTGRDAQEPGSWLLLRRRWGPDMDGRDRNRGETERVQDQGSLLARRRSRVHRRLPQGLHDVCRRSEDDRPRERFGRARSDRPGL